MIVIWIGIPNGLIFSITVLLRNSLNVKRSKGKLVGLKCFSVPPVFSIKKRELTSHCEINSLACNHKQLCIYDFI